MRILILLEERATSLWAELESAISEDHTILVLRLTVVMLVLHGVTTVASYVPVVIIGGGILVFPRLSMQPILWAALAACTILDCAINWYAVDNHKFLMMYWTVTCLFAVSVKGELGSLGDRARTLVGLTFACATIWKVVGMQYFDGSFMTATFALDSRLEPVAAALTGRRLEDYSAVGDALRYLARLGATGIYVPVPSSRSIEALSLGLSWAGLVAEGALAVAHAFPARFYQLRHRVLMTFVAGTYFLFPVIGFAFVLAVLGLAQCLPGDSRNCVRYLVILGIIQFTQLPWKALLPG